MTPAPARALRARAGQIRLVVTDLDGTLLNSRKELTPRTLQAVGRLGGAGIAFTVCSGRVFSMLGLYIRRLGLTTPLISANGAVISHPVTGRIYRQSPIPGEEAAEFMNYCRRQRLEYAALTPGGCYFSPGSACLSRFEGYNSMARAAGLPQIPLFLMGEGRDRPGSAPDGPIHKMLLCGAPPQEREEAARFVEERLPGMDSTTSDPQLLDLSARGVDKGRGLAQLSRLLAIPLEQICVFGDFHNDLTMLQAAGLPVAMGNGCEEAKAAALCVAPSNDEDGVARALEDLFLARKGSL